MKVILKDKHMPSSTAYSSIGWGKETFEPLVLSENACEFMWTMQPGGAVPEHLHKDCDEHFEVLEGEVTLKLAGKTIAARAGETITVPSMTPHSPANKSATDLRCRVWFTPAADQAKFLQIMLFLKSEKIEGMPAVFKAMHISNGLGYKEFSTVRGGMKAAEKLIMGWFKLTAPLMGWNKLMRRFAQQEAKAS